MHSTNILPETKVRGKSQRQGLYKPQNSEVEEYISLNTIIFHVIYYSVGVYQILSGLYYFLKSEKNSEVEEYISLNTIIFMLSESMVVLSYVGMHMGKNCQKYRLQKLYSAENSN